MIKDNIIKVIDELSKKEYLNDCELQLSINGDDVRNYKDIRNILFSDAIDDVKKILNNFTDDIEGYNITLEKKNNYSFYYSPGWKSVSYTFWSGNDSSGDKDIDTSKYGMFEWRYLGDAESYDTNGIRNKLMERIFEGEEVVSVKYYNYFEYGKIEKIIDSLIELDLLIDKQHKEKIEIYEKIKFNPNAIH